MGLMIISPFTAPSAPSGDPYGSPGTPGVGSPGLGFIQEGEGNLYNTTFLYNMATDTLGTGSGSLASRKQGAAAGSADQIVIFGGMDNNFGAWNGPEAAPANFGIHARTSIEYYPLSTQSYVTSTAINQTRMRNACAGNYTYALTFGGWSNGARLGTFELYHHANHTNVQPAGTGTYSKQMLLNGFGNSAKAMFPGGEVVGPNPYDYTDHITLYTYATHTSGSFGTTLLAASRYVSAGSNDTIGMTVHGFGYTKFNMASETRLHASTQPLGTGAGSETGGFASQTQMYHLGNNIKRIDFATDTHTDAGSLGYTYAMTASNAHGGLV